MSAPARDTDGPLADVIPLTRVEPWVKTPELAAHLGVADRTIRRYMREGLPHRKLGRAVRFRLSAVDEWLDGRQT